MKLTGAGIIIECLCEQNVDVVFGYPGGAILNVYDELYRHSDRIKHILTAHEQGASHAADGYSRSTGKVGVCLATSGPGATNIVTGLATAHMDSIPMVAITCNVTSNLLGKDSFQEVDIAGITMPVTKHNYIVSNVDDLADTIREAFVIANSGRKGPVLIDIPKDITAAVTEYSKPTSTTEYCKEIPVMTEEQLDYVVECIRYANSPIVIAGGGVISGDASGELMDFVTKLNCPVTTTFMGTGAFPADHPLYTGMIGMHGTKASNVGVNRCDLVIAVGARFSDRVTSNASTFARHAKIIHIDIDAAEINKNVLPHFGVAGDCKDVLARVTAKMKAKELSDVAKEIFDFRKLFPSMDKGNPMLNPEFIISKACEYTPDDAIITTEVGQHQMWVQQFYNFTKPRTFISSGGLGTMGFGTGAAMGSMVGNPDKKVIHFAGDGSFRMNCNELSTISAYNIPVIIVVINNGVLGMVRQWQTLFYDKRYSETTLNTRGPNFKLLAEAFGIKGYTVTTKEEYEAAIKEATASGVPCVIDAQVHEDCCVMPMVPPGKAIKNCISSVEEA